MTELPMGTITFLMTDVEGSTQLWERHPETMRTVLARHDHLISETVASHDGHVIKSRGEGDAIFAIFARATDAAAAAAACQQALAAEAWPPGITIRVRMALHTGEADLREGDYYGPTINRCARLRSIGHGGQVLLTEVTAGLVRAALPPGVDLRGLGTHRLKDLAAPETIYQLTLPDLPAEFAPLRSLSTVPNNLPLQVTSFVGRERELDQVKQLLTDARLITLTGAGGCGKTRLALQVAADLSDAYADGAWLVELAAITEPELVAQALAEALLVKEQAGRPLEATLVEYLSGRQVLLLLDNCEHLIEACAPLVVSLLRACSRVQILATSRAVLNVPGETSWRVPPLSLPNPHRLPPLEQMTTFEAVRLFIDRAKAAQPSFAVTDRNAPALAQICTRLDGIPLALELAAARVKVMSLEQIASRLDDRFRLLTGGARTALPRHQTLRAAVDWSHEQLSDDERVLFRRLGVFRGGCNLETAEAVCGGEANATYLDEFAVVDLLAQLVDKSLVLVEESDGAVRYRLLESLRQYAVEKLQAAGEAEPLHGRHLAWCLALAEEQAADRSGAGVARLEPEQDNVRAALEWSLGTGGDPEAAARLCVALLFFWRGVNRLHEGLRWFDATLRQGERLGTEGRLTALLTGSRIAMWMGDIRKTEAWAEAALAVARSTGNRGAEAAALAGLGTAAEKAGHHDRGESLLAESLAISRQIADRDLIARSANNLATLFCDRGEYTHAMALYQEAAAMCRAIGETWGVITVTRNMAEVAMYMDDLAAAEQHLAEIRVPLRQMGVDQDTHELGLVASLALASGDYVRAAALDEETIALIRAGGEAQFLDSVEADLALAHCGLGDPAAASAVLRRILQRAREDGRDGSRLPLPALAVAATGLGQYERAARLAGAAATLIPFVPPYVARMLATAQAAAQVALGESAYGTAYAAGQAIAATDVLTYCLEIAS